MENETYNGWTNRETWLVNLWLTNEEPTYDTLTEIVKGKGENFEKADRLQEFVNELTDLSDLTNQGFNQDLIGTALQRVDWLAIVVNHSMD